MARPTQAAQAEDASQACRSVSGIPENTEGPSWIQSMDPGQKAGKKD